MRRIENSPVKFQLPVLTRYENAHHQSTASTQASTQPTATLAVFCDETVECPVYNKPIPIVTRARTPAPVLARAPNKIRVGDTLYTELELLGSGGYSFVHKVKAPNGQTFALKRVQIDGPNRDALPDLKGEIQLLSQLEGCAHVVQLIAFECNTSLITMVMERGDRDLHTIMNAPNFSEDHIPFYISQLLDCVAEVHDRGIVHSDLKPANFVLCNGIVKLIDFGISSRIPDSTCHIYKTSAIGTLSYMAPETLRESTCIQTLKYGKPSDMWSLGCIFFEMFYGAPPFKKYRRSQMDAIAGPTAVSFPSASIFGAVPDKYLNLMRGLLNKNAKLRLDMPKAKALLSAKVSVSQAFLYDLVAYATDLGAKPEQKRTDERLRVLADAVFAKLKSLSQEA